jgi:hypothetical protein
VQLTDDEQIPDIIAKVLDEFPNVFDEPKELPPHREYDHTILLLLDAALVNSRPYRYSPLHKDEIEKTSEATSTNRTHYYQHKSLCFSCPVSVEEGWHMEILCRL